MGKSRAALNFLLKFWSVGRFFNWLGRQHPINQLFQSCFSPENNHAVIIPINQVIRGTESIVLPQTLLMALVDQASDCYVLEECLCRQAEHCHTYPHELGCLFLGSGANRIHPSMGHKATRETAVAHIQKAVQLGLVPLIVHTAFDAYMLGIPYHQMLAICFCCDCCCTVRSGLRLGPPAFWDSVERLPGLTVEVDAVECVGCGDCLEVCSIQAIQLDGGIAIIGDRCKGCGRCVDTCPVGAIRMSADDVPGMADFLRKRIEQRTDIFASPLIP